MGQFTISCLHSIVHRPAIFSMINRFGGVSNWNMNWFHYKLLAYRRCFHENRYVFFSVNRLNTKYWKNITQVTVSQPKAWLATENQHHVAPPPNQVRAKINPATFKFEPLAAKYIENFSAKGMQIHLGYIFSW